MGNKCETGNVKRFFLLLLGSFLSLSAWAQTGVICGTVSDAKFKDALIGASVVIEGTTVGAIADVEGNFRIENVKPGKYTIVASYVSYKSETIRDVVVKAHQESVLRIELSDADLQLQNVVVVAQRKLGTETAIINTVFQPNRSARHRTVMPPRCCAVFRGLRSWMTVLWWSGGWRNDIIMYG